MVKNFLRASVALYMCSVILLFNKFMFYVVLYNDHLLNHRLDKLDFSVGKLVGLIKFLVGPGF